jgi:hypothetical protein
MSKLLKSAVLASALMLSTVGFVAQAEGPPLVHYQGSSLYNEKHEKIGVIQDMLVSTMGGESYVLLDVTGMAGARKVIAVPMSHINFTGAEPMMAATKQDVMSWPAFSGGGR